ncbi:hypothetical protein WJX81_004862 [Elliptochloris bilobata]|uniref:AAA+ ATPase domain-containing protein n=1 Tax=Elliptochloris bilobata TaxID=381761 RepID=A0AAW1QJP4_9CHLO
MCRPPSAQASPPAGASDRIAVVLPPASCSGRQLHEPSPRGARDTGMRLAALPDEEEYKPTREEYRRAIERSGASETQKRKLLAPRKKGRKMDVRKSTVPDPTLWDKKGGVTPQTSWRRDLMKRLTYTQFWQLIKERQIDKAQYTADKRSILVTTKDTAPGGRRTEKVGLPYDPELYDHMMEHGVHIADTPVNRYTVILAAFIRLFFPIWFAYLLIRVAFRIGVKKRDRIFGGAHLELIGKGKARTTFNDIAGIDQVKGEIQEVVEFLRNPRRFLNLGARSPAGILLVGPPGTGKTLLAKAIAGEANVPFFSAAGTEFMEVFVGVGAARVRDMFQKARKRAPCILFIDEFDGIGQQRSYSAMGNDESVQTINQLLTEMDGFDDNTGVVVMAATNRPAALDSALTRPGRFDRVIHLPLPNLEGRVEILQVHARGKKLAEGIDFKRVARATAGSTGAELMNVMNTAGMVAVRRGAKVITEDDIFQALENIQQEKLGAAGSGGSGRLYDDDIVPPVMRKGIAVYEAARALMGLITPHYDEISKVSVCPGGVPTGYTYFIPQEELLESRVMTRGYMEARMVVSLAGRCAERMVLGESRVSTAGARDLDAANNVAREMVYRCGFSRRLGPVALMGSDQRFLHDARTRGVSNISTELARIALADVRDLVEGAEAKAYYGLVINYRALEALIDRLLVKETLTGNEVREIAQEAGLKPFPDPYVEGFKFDDEGQVVYPGMQVQADELMPEGAPPVPRHVRRDRGGEEKEMLSRAHPRNPYRVRVDLVDNMLPELKV